MGLLSHLKDLALGRAVRVYLNHHFHSLGHMTTLRIDTDSHTLELTADLAGETQPIELKAAYRLEETDGTLALLPTRVECSRAWIELLARQLLADGALRLPVPPGLATTAVKMLKV